METSEQPGDTGPKPEEPSLRDVVRAIDGLASRMDVIISHLDKLDTLPEAPQQRTSTSRDQQEPVTPLPSTPGVPSHRTTAAGPPPLQIPIPVPPRSTPTPPVPRPASPTPAPPPPRPPKTIPVPVPPQPVAQNTDAKTSSPGSPDEVPLSELLGSPSPKPSPLNAIRDRAGEAALGKYLLSAAAAVLVFLAAASLIALLWNSIPDIVKVGTVGVTGVTLTVAKKVKPEGARRKTTVYEDETYRYDEIAYAKSKIRFK